MTRIIDDTKLDFQDVLLMPKRSVLESRSQVSLNRTYKFKHAKDIEYSGVPILAANMDHTGTFEMAKALGGVGMTSTSGLGIALHKFYTAQQLFEYYRHDPLANNCTFYSMGITDDDLKKFKELIELLNGKTPKMVCVDVANGYSRKFVSFVEELRESYPNIVIMAGNVVTPDMTYDLLERGADIVKVGIGPGSVCTTRKITGVGYPQLSAIMECADAAHGANGLICGDGGITSPGDIAKAFAAGADFVMCGGLFAGHAECAGQKPRGIIKKETLRELDRVFKTYQQHPHNTQQLIHLPSGKQWVVSFAGADLYMMKNLDAHEAIDEIIKKLPEECFETPESNTMKFYGMSSKEAMDAHYGGKANYRASEGKAVEIPYKGPVVNTVEEILGGLRSACTYVGAETLKQLPKCATFVKVGRQLNTVFGEE